jgi:FHS family L-fucose permease-like MFS transporter
VGRDKAKGRPFGSVIFIAVSLFFFWGMANNLNDILIAQFKKAFVLSDFGTSFIQQVFYLGYFLFAIPASIVMQSKGYKAAIVIGLILYGVGALLFYPAASFAQYPLFLAALFIIAAGLAFLETSANPLMTEVGDPAGAARRLNWAQAANPLGAITGILIGRIFILSGIEHDEATLATMQASDRLLYYRHEIEAVQAPYLAIGLAVLLFAAITCAVRFPKIGTQAPHDPRSAAPAFASLLGEKQLLLSVMAQFFYVGAQVGIWSFTIRYAQANLPGLGERAAADMLFGSLVLFAAGRFLGTAMMTRIRPAKLLGLFALLSLGLMLIAIFKGGAAGAYALVSTSFFMSIQFPTIFALGVEGLGPLRRTGASLIVMAIIGGAALTGLMGLVSDRAGIAAAMIVPAVSFVAIGAFALLSLHSPERQLA